MKNNDKAINENDDIQMLVDQPNSQTDYEINVDYSPISKPINKFGEKPKEDNIKVQDEVKPFTNEVQPEINPKNLKMMHTIESVEEIQTSQDEIPIDQIPQNIEEDKYEYNNQDSIPFDENLQEEPDEYIQIEGVEQPHIVLNTPNTKKADSIRYQDPDEENHFDPPIDTNQNNEEFKSPVEEEKPFDDSAQINQPAESEPIQNTKEPENSLDQNQQELDEEAEELRKLEEEVAFLQKEAEANLVNSSPENPAEISIIDEQIIIVDGKRKKKKKKKKKRKKIGGGEETIANITIEEVNEEEESEVNQIELNPVQKKKKKHKNTPHTELGPVEEDSKEQSTLMDMKVLASIEGQNLQNLEEFYEENDKNSMQNKEPEEVKENLPEEIKEILLEEGSESKQISENINNEKVISPKIPKIEENEAPVQSKWKLPEDDIYEENNQDINISKEVTNQNELNKEIDPFSNNHDENEISIPNSQNNHLKDYKYLRDGEDFEDNIEKESKNDKQAEEPVLPEKFEILKIPTEDLSNFVQKIVPNINKHTSKNLSIKSEVIKGPLLSTSEGEIKADNFQEPVSLLSINCEIHKNEYIKYFCREEDCKFGLCQLCLYEHINHDYIYADEIASFEIKQSLKATMTECTYKIKSQSMLFNETEKLAKFIDDLKLQEYEKIHYYFMDLHKELDKREKQLKEIYQEEVKDIEGILK